MILEIILIAAILGIFFIIVRRLPEALRSETPTSDVPAGLPRVVPRSIQTSKGSGVARWLAGLFPKRREPAVTPVSPPPAVLVSPAPSNVEQQTTVLSEDTLLAEGDQFLSLGKLKEAERAFLRAVAKNPKNPKLYNRLGAIYLKSRSYSDALETFEAARDLDASKASRHYNVALAAWHLGKRAKAREAIAQAISLDPASQSYQELKSRIEE